MTMLLNWKDIFVLSAWVTDLQKADRCDLSENNERLKALLTYFATLDALL